MRWAILLMMLAAITAIIIVIRGAVVLDGLSLLAVALVAAAVMALFLSHWAGQRDLARKHHR